MKQQIRITLLAIGFSTSALVFLGSGKPRESASSDDVSSLVLCYNVSVADLTNLYNQSGNTGVIFHVFPVKNDTSIQAGNFKLMVFTTDLAGNPLGGPTNLNSFKTGFANYVNYLRSLSIPRVDIAEGYQFSVNPPLFNVCRDFAICVDLLQQQMTVNSNCYQYCEPPGKLKYEADSVGACCKCPPACNESTYTSEASKIISKNFKKKQPK